MGFHCCEYENGEAFLEASKDQDITVLFLDIYMDGANGIEIAKEFRKSNKDCLLIFTTTSSDHALEGFQVRAMHYLVKPYTEDELSSLTDEILSRIPTPEKTLPLKVNGSEFQVPFKTIVHADHFSHMIHIHTTAKKELVIRQSFLRGYIVIVYALLLILALFYTMFLMMANILNKNQKLQQENLFLSVQQERYENLRSAIEEARQARHDIRHHFVQLSVMAEDGNLEKIKDYLQNAMDKIPGFDFHFCENQYVDNVIGYYYALAQKEEIPFDARVDLPQELSVDEMDLCLILSNLLENALEASRKTTMSRQQILLEIRQHSASLLLIRVENNFDGIIKEKNHLLHSTKRKGLGIGTQSVRRMAEKNDGSCNFTYENGVFTAKIMLRATL